MDRTAIEQRLQSLQSMKVQQQERLERARQEQQAALTSLERIEGARQDCEFWLEQIDLDTKQAESNGALESELTRN